jgi:hypothetical protein
MPLCGLDCVALSIILIDSCQMFMMIGGLAFRYKLLFMVSGLGSSEDFVTSFLYHSFAEFDVL